MKKENKEMQEKLAVLRGEKDQVNFNIIYLS